MQKAKALYNTQVAINQGANAQLALRDLHLDRLQAQLHEKHAKKDSRRNIMGTKAAQFFSGDEFRNLKQKQEEEDALKLVQQQANASERELGKKHQEWREQERSEREANQKAAVAKWEAMTTCLKKQGRVKIPEKLKIRKLFPRTPTPVELQSKKKWAVAQEEDSEVDEGLSSEFKMDWE